jgi:hypothetical protein
LDEEFVLVEGQDALRVFRAQREGVRTFRGDLSLDGEFFMREGDLHRVVRKGLFEEFAGDRIRIGDRDGFGDRGARLRRAEVALAVRKPGVLDRVVVLGIEADFLHALDFRQSVGGVGLRDIDRAPRTGERRRSVEHEVRTLSVVNRETRRDARA